MKEPEIEMSYMKDPHECQKHNYSLVNQLKYNSDQYLYVLLCFRNIPRPASYDKV